jgi:LacI family transcriptional regulator
VRIADWDQVNGGYEATLDLLNKARGRVRAILYGNSQLLLGGYKAIHGLGLRLPQDLAVAGFDPPYVIDSLAPRPTCLGKVEESIGLTAARRLPELFAGREPASPRQIRIRSDLVIGGSS